MLAHNAMQTQKVEQNKLQVIYLYKDMEQHFLFE